MPSLWLLVFELSRVPTRFLSVSRLASETTRTLRINLLLVFLAGAEAHGAQTFDCVRAS